MKQNPMGGRKLPENVRWMGRRSVLYFHAFFFFRNCSVRVHTQLLQLVNSRPPPAPPNRYSLSPIPLASVRKVTELGKHASAEDSLAARADREKAERAKRVKSRKALEDSAAANAALQAAKSFDGGSPGKTFDGGSPGKTFDVGSPGKTFDFSQGSPFAQGLGSGAKGAGLDEVSLSSQSIDSTPQAPSEPDAPGGSGSVFSASTNSSVVKLRRWQVFKKCF